MLKIKSVSQDFTGPKSVLFEKCREHINAGNRGESLILLIQLSEICSDETEIQILAQLKLEHRIQFTKDHEYWAGSGKSICGINYTKIFSNMGSVEGGKRLDPKIKKAKANPKVSIITINRNCALGLENTIKSVIAQKNDFDGIEHIIIDGASTDGSLDIIRKYENQIDYFISETDGGIYPAMNKGLNFARGNIIAFLNSDDTYRRGAIKLSVENIERHNVDISFGAFAYLKSNGYNEVVDGPREWDESLLLRGIPGGHGTFFVRRDVYDKIGGYREDFRIVSDYEWMIRAFLAGFTANPIRKILHQMTQGGISFNSDLEKEENIKLFCQYLGEINPRSIEKLYSLKYYLHWEGFSKSHEEQIYLLEMATTLQDFEPIYAKAIVKTLTRGAQDFVRETIPLPQKLEVGKLKICVALTYLNSTVGGAERIAIDAANRLANDGHAVTIICCHSLSGDPFYKIDPKIEFLDLANKPLSRALHRRGEEDWDLAWHMIGRTLNSDESADIITWLRSSNKWVTLVYRGFFKLNDFDIVLSHMPSTYPYVSLALAGKPQKPYHIAILHNSPKYKFKSQLYSTGPDSEKRVWLSTLGMCDQISVLFKEFIDELPETLRSKAFVLPNFIDDTFRSTKAPLEQIKLTRKIVSVGRLVPQKNHKALIAAFALIRQQVKGWNLEIYGEGPLKKELEDFCEFKGLDPIGILLGRTSEPKAVYDSADIFVFPSHFEGFGLALVEAMASGLPVVGFEDCPGVKFIIEHEVNGLLAKEDEDSISLANTILQLINDDSLCRKLGKNAALSAESYTLNKHIEQLSFNFKLPPKALVCRTTKDFLFEESPTVAIICTTPSGGAGVAASRLQDGLIKIGLASCMFSTTRRATGPSLLLDPKFKDPAFIFDNWRISSRTNLKFAGATIFSSEIGSLCRSDIKPAIACDIINLHWISHLLSPTSIKWLIESGKPVVWTLHDMLPFTGGCHYNNGCDRYTINCEDCPQVVDNYNNHPSIVLSTKSELWRSKITVISPSSWLANEARKSKVFANSRIEVVPNGIDTLEFQPWNKIRTREILGLPKDKRILLFACHSHAERRKGFQEALMMLISLNRRRKDLHLVTLGRSSEEAFEIPISNSNFGFVDSSRELSMIYSACDVTVLPSLEDNLPNIILESFACGTPIAAFKAGGIEEIVEDGVTGHLAPAKDFISLRDAVEKCIDSDLGHNCRNYAVRNLDSTKQANAYADIFYSLSKYQR